LAEHPAAGVAGRWRAGTLLFADLVGFTALTDAYAQRGQDGAEALTAVLDACFGRLIDAITDHGGDVLRIPGDAVLAFWDAHDAGLAPTVERATRCAVRLQAHFAAGAQATAERRLRIGIAVGEVLVARVGGAEGRWELVVLGWPLAELAAASRTAEPGDIVLTRRAWEHIGDRVSGIENEGFVRISGLAEDAALPLHMPRTSDLRPEMLEAVRAFIPRTVLQRMDAGQMEWLAEFRQASVLFLGLAGLPYPTPDSLEPLQDALQCAQSLVYRHGGGINQVVVDDNGLVMVAVWGCGLHAHADDPKRAVQAALAVSEALVPRLPATAIAVTTGRVYFGRRGNIRRSEYAVIGGSVNLAARLMQAAKGRVLCDQATADACRERFELDALPPMRLKGKAEPVAVHQALGARTTRPEEEVELTGREREVALLHAQVDALACDRRGGIVIIEGEAGIGKSRLVAELLRYVADRREDVAPR
jgi:class 3 adenylate cyclase